MNEWLKNLPAHLERNWLSDMPAARLACVRVLVGLYALYYVGTRRDMLAALGATPDFLYNPVGPFRFLGGPLSPELFGLIVDATLIFGVAFVVGFKQRFVGPIFGLLLLVTFSYRNSWSMIYHSHNLVVLHALILGFSRSADAFSIDAWLGRDRADERHWRYGWPILLLSIVTVSVYFLAGVAKVTSELGWAWALGDSLRDQIAVDAIRKEVFGTSGAPLAYALYDYVWLFTLLGIGSLILELGAPAALLGRRWSYAWVLTVWSLHWGILFVMGITFRYQLTGLVFASFLPLEQIVFQARGIVERLRHRKRTAVPTDVRRAAARRAP